MKVEYLDDAAGNHEAVKIAYTDWMEIVQKHDIPVEEPNLFDRYAATESLYSILNGLIALTNRELWKADEYGQTDPKRVKELADLHAEVIKLRNDPENFTDTRAMERLADQYSEILLTEEKKSLV